MKKSQISIIGIILIVLLVFTLIGYVSPYYQKKTEGILKRENITELQNYASIVLKLLEQERQVGVDFAGYHIGALGAFPKGKSECGYYSNFTSDWLDKTVPYFKNMSKECLPEFDFMKRNFEFFLNSFFQTPDYKVAEMIINFLQEKNIPPIFSISRYLAEVENMSPNSVIINFIPLDAGGVFILRYQNISYVGSLLISDTFDSDLAKFVHNAKDFILNNLFEKWVNKIIEPHTKISITLNKTSTGASSPGMCIEQPSPSPLPDTFLERPWCVFLMKESCYFYTDDLGGRYLEFSNEHCENCYSQNNCLGNSDECKECVKDVSGFEWEKRIEGESDNDFYDRTNNECYEIVKNKIYPLLDKYIYARLPEFERELSENYSINWKILPLELNVSDIKFSDVTIPPHEWNETCVHCGEVSFEEQKCKEFLPDWKAVSLSHNINGNRPEDPFTATLTLLNNGNTYERKYKFTAKIDNSVFVDEIKNTENTLNPGESIQTSIPSVSLYNNFGIYSGTHTLTLCVDSAYEDILSGSSDDIDKNNNCISESFEVCEDGDLSEICCEKKFNGQWLQFCSEVYGDSNAFKEVTGHESWEGFSCCGDDTKENWCLIINGKKGACVTSSPATIVTDPDKSKFLCEVCLKRVWFTGQIFGSGGRCCDPGDHFYNGTGNQKTICDNGVVFVGECTADEDCPNDRCIGLDFRDYYCDLNTRTCKYIQKCVAGKCNSYCCTRSDCPPDGCYDSEGNPGSGPGMYYREYSTCVEKEILFPERKRVRVCEYTERCTPECCESGSIPLGGTGYICDGNNCIRATRCDWLLGWWCNWPPYSWWKWCSHNAGKGLPSKDCPI